MTLVTRDQAYVWHPYTPLRGDDEPLPVISANAEWLTLADGSRPRLPAGNPPRR